MSDRVKLIQGNSVDHSTVCRVVDLIPKGARVMVVLDSNHSEEHVLAELRAYAPLVTEGCYLVVADTILGHLEEERAPTRGSQFLFRGNEPLSARDIFLAECDRFEIDEDLNGKLVLSSSPGGYLRCISAKD